MAGVSFNEGNAGRIVQYVKSHPEINGLKVLSKCEQIEVEERSTTKPPVWQCTSGPHGVEMKVFDEKEDVLQLNIEYEMWVLLNELLPKNIQKPLAFDQDAKMVIMERIPDGYEALFVQFLDSRVDKVAIQQTAQLLGKLQRTTHAMINNPDKKLNSQNSTSISDLSSALFSISNEDDTVTDRRSLLRDPNIRAKIGRIEQLFDEKRECLMLGSLDPTVIYAGKGHPIISYETSCRTGPFGFDLGTLLASYMALYHQHMLTPENNDAHRRVAYKMMDACKDTVSTYLDEMESILSQAQVDQILSDVAGFAACELIRRSCPSSTYTGLTTASGAVLEELYESGLRLLRQYDTIHDIGRLLMIGLMLC